MQSSRFSREPVATVANPRTTAFEPATLTSTDTLVRLYELFDRAPAHLRCSLTGDPQWRWRAGHSSSRPSTCHSMSPTHIRPGNGIEWEPEPRVRIWSTVGSHLDDVTPDELAAITNVLDHSVPPHVRVGDTNGALRCSHVR